ncbi:hypothetical protein CI610_00597 [invertebrate metagenome]|uniref:EscE/YscE/SsaE family type III secretion system needle protein co-chaperone n=1 Tax=invertebrate metagenome TaxID=1711999 RepID=A0A2H9TB34_9ZZZZ
MHSQKTKKKDNPVYLSEIHEQLINDKEAKIRDVLTQALFEQMLELKNRRDQGASPDEYQQLEALILAIAAAGEAIGKVWKREHDKH